MTASDLDTVYTALAEALGRAGEANAARLLAVLALDLIADGDDPSRALAAVARSERLAAQ